MALQTKISNRQALGVAGQISKGYHNYSNVTYGIVADANVKVGYFCQSKENAINENEIIGTKGVAVNGKILGVVVKNHFIDSCGTSTIDTYRIGDNVAILNIGSVFIECDSIATKGQYVFLNNANGALAFGDKMVMADHTYTGFLVSVGNKTATKGIIEITTANAYTISKSDLITL